MIRKQLLILISLLFIVATANAEYLAPEDSVGKKVEDGKVFILYRVEPKETLFGISNKYNLTVAELIKHNPEVEAGLKVGAIIKVPYKTVVRAADNTKYHIVEPSETLYSISKKYNVEVADIKKWNNLPGNAINVGDRLALSQPSESTERTPRLGSESQDKPKTPDYGGKIVHTVEEKETLYSIARMYDTSVEKVKAWNDLTTNSLSVGQKLIVGTTQGFMASGSRGDRAMRDGSDDTKAREYSFNNNPVSITQIGDPSQTELEEKALGSTAVKKITELGMAAVIDDSLNTKKYLALHKNAPIGTIMQVYNEMNNLSVFVRVVGKLPETGNNDKVVIKLSKKAFEKLGAYNDKFPVRLSYVP